MGRKIKENIAVFLLSLILFWVCSPLRAFSVYYAAIIESAVYSFVTFLVLKHIQRGNVVNVISFLILGRVIIELPIRLVDFDKTLSTLMVTISVILSIILTGIIYCKRKAYIITLSLICWGYCVFVGHRAWCNYVNYGSLPHIKMTSYMVQAPDNEIRLDTIKSKYILLDFWNASCGVCIQQFPRFQELYDNYKDKMLIRSVFVRYKKDETISDGMDLIDKLEYKFPIWSVDKGSSLIEDLNVKVYPTVIVIDQDKRIVFKGSLDKAEEMLSTFNY